MKPGDRVRVLRGEHEGRCGVIVDPAESIASVRRLITPSATRDHLEEGLAVPAGCQLVRLDRPDLRDAAYVANRTVSIEELDLWSIDVLPGMPNDVMADDGVRIDIEDDTKVPGRQIITMSGSGIDFIERVRNMPHRIPLLEYLAELEVIARAAPGGRWRNPNVDVTIRYGHVVTDELPHDDGYHGQLIAESMSGRAMALLIATQPAATIALISKLLGAVDLAEVAIAAAGPGQCEYSETALRQCRSRLAVLKTWLVLK